MPYVTTTNSSCMPVYIGDREIMLKDKPFELTVNTKQEELIEILLKDIYKKHKVIQLIIKALKLKSIKEHYCNERKIFDIALGIDVGLFDIINEDYLLYIKNVLNYESVSGNNSVNCIIQVDW